MATRSAPTPGFACLPGSHWAVTHTHTGGVAVHVIEKERQVTAGEVDT